MGCKQLQLNSFFEFAEPEEINRSNFRFVESKMQAPCTYVPRNRAFKSIAEGFNYDDLKRLVREESQCTEDSTLNYTSEYAYDLVGNRLKHTFVSSVPFVVNYSYNDNDQLIEETSSTDGTTEYQYDANGSLITKSNTTTGENYAYTYNLQNRLASASITRTEKDELGTPKLVEITANYAYNINGIRVVSNTTTTIDGGTSETKNRTYLLDSGFTGYQQILEELDADTNTPIKTYTLGDDVLSQLVTAKPSEAGTTALFLYDGHGSTRLLTSDTGTITARYNYDAYGKNLFSANVTTQSATDMLYSGEQFDPNLQMQYLRARYYDQNNGTFNRLDPFAGNNYDPQSLHKYGYCHSDPVNNIDPSGEFTLAGILAVTAVQAILYTMILGAVVNVVTGGALFEGLQLTLYYLLEPATWLIAALNVLTGMKSLVSDPMVLAYVLVSIAANILTGGVFGVFTNVLAAIGMVQETTGIANSGAPIVAVAFFTAVTIATIVLGLAIGAIIAKAFKLIGPIISKMTASFKKFFAPKSVSPEIRALSEANITDNGITVLGRYQAPPGRMNYIQKATTGKYKGSSYFDLGDAWTPVEGKAANRYFLNIVGEKGDKIIFSTPKGKIPLGSSLDMEVQYLKNNFNYKWVNQWSMQAR